MRPLETARWRGGLPCPRVTPSDGPTAADSRMRRIFPVCPEARGQTSQTAIPDQDRLNPRGRRRNSNRANRGRKRRRKISPVSAVPLRRGAIWGRQRVPPRFTGTRLGTPRLGQRRAAVAPSRRQRAGTQAAPRRWPPPPYLTTETRPCPSRRSPGSLK